MYKESSIRELIDHNMVYQLLSDKLDIVVSDYSKTFRQVCDEKKMDYAFIESLLKTYDEGYRFPYAELSQCCIAELLNYLQKSHDYYLRKKLPEIEQSAVQVYQKYGESYPLLSFLCLFFTDYKKRIEEHIRFEEKNLFPYINALLQADAGESTSADILKALNSFSTRQFINGHTHIEDELQEVRKTILTYSSGSQVPLPFRVFLNQLHFFEIELTRHAKVEDEVLIPKIIELEAHLLKKAAGLSLNKYALA